jgi:hypothetical protein
MIAFMGCKKDNPTNSQPEIPTPAVQGQVVHLELGLDENDPLELDAQLGQQPVKVFSMGDGMGSVLIPLNAPVGTTTLTFSTAGLGTKTLAIEALVLTETPEITLEPFFDLLDSIQVQADTSQAGAAVVSSIAAFNQYYAGASAAQKLEFAQFYSANKALFEEIFLKGNSEKLIPDTYSYVAKHVKYVAVMAAGCAIMLGGNPIIGGALAIAGAYKAYQANADAINNIYETISVKFNDITGGANKTATSALRLSQGKPFNLSVAFPSRKLIASDANKTEPLAVTYFKAYNTYNYFANACNSVIQATNNTFGTTFSNMSLYSLPVSRPTVDRPLTQSMFQAMSFSLGNGASIQSIQWLSDGQIQLVAQIGSNLDSVNTFLSYQYNDQYSQFSGQIPVVVKRVAELSGVSFQNQTAIGIPCPGLDHSCSWDLLFQFTSSPSEDVGIAARTIWDANGDGVFEGNTSGGFGLFDLNSNNISGSSSLQQSNFCWGQPVTVLKFQFYQVYPDGSQGPLKEVFVPRF